MIVTLQLDAASSQFFDHQRRRFFPAERNFLTAHVTLFHKLPGEREEEVRASLARAARETPAFSIEIEGLRSLGRGVAYALGSPDELSRLHSALAARFVDFLTPQDSQPLRPHVTVQNKVSPEAARALLDGLRRDFQPWTARALGLELWAYRGGPWSALGFFPFGGGEG